LFGELLPLDTTKRRPGPHELAGYISENINHLQGGTVENLPPIYHAGMCRGVVEELS